MNGQNIGYIRVSSVSQNTVRQLSGINLHKIFTDKCSGKDAQRPQLELMLEFIRDGDTVYIHSMDRLARNLIDLKILVRRMTSKKAKVIFVKENLTFTGDDSAMSNLLLSVMGAFAEFERTLIKERQMEGIVIAKQNGRFKGRVQSLTVAQIAEMKQMLIDRYKKTEIAQKFNITRQTLYRYINSNEFSL